MWRTRVVDHRQLEGVGLFSSPRMRRYGFTPGLLFQQGCQKRANLVSDVTVELFRYTLFALGNLSLGFIKAASE